VLFLLDTNVALRLTDPGVPRHAMLVAAMERLVEGGHRPCFVPQNVVEMWNVCTRPVANNGLGLTVAETDARVKRLESKFLFLPDSDCVSTASAGSSR
jgi:predicted nucleic acid-binding protein